MTFYTLKKTFLHLSLSVFLCLAVWLFSEHNQVYAGFMAGFLGAAYLLASWLAYLKHKGSDPFAFLKRKRSPSVPYIHRRDKGSASRLRFFRERHEYEDDGADDDNPLDKNARTRCNAIAFLACGAVMLVLSMLPL